MELPDAIRDHFVLVAAFLPGMSVPQRTELSSHLGFERSRLIDHVVAAAGAYDPELRHDVVLTRPSERHDLMLAPWHADFGHGFAVFDPDRGAHFWQEQEAARGGLPGRLAMTKALRTEGWAWVKQDERAHRGPAGPVEVEQFATAVVASEALAASLALRPWESIGPAVAAELAGVGSDAGLGRLGWVWSLTWAAEFLDVPEATPWRKDCEHRMRELHPPLAGAYHRRRSFVSGPAAMSLAAEQALRHVRGDMTLPGLDRHLATLRGATDPAAFASKLAGIRERVHSRHMPHPQTASLGFTLTSGGMFTPRFPVDIDGRLADLPAARPRPARPHRPSTPSRRSGAPRHR